MSQTADSSRLRPCPDCGHTCSVDAVNCPSCGRPHPAAPVAAAVPPATTAAPAAQPAPMDAPVTAQDLIFSHIMNQSSMKVGMCLTLLGLIKVVEGAKNLSTLADEFLAATALLFIISNVFTFHAFKQANDVRRKKLGRIGDRVYTTGLAMLALICGILVFELI